MGFLGVGWERPHELQKHHKHPSITTNKRFLILLSSYVAVMVSSLHTRAQGKGLMWDVGYAYSYAKIPCLPTKGSISKPEFLCHIGQPPG